MEYRTPLQKYWPIIAILLLALSAIGMGFWIFGPIMLLILMGLISGFVAFGR